MSIFAIMKQSSLLQKNHFVCNCTTFWVLWDWHLVQTSPTLLYKAKVLQTHSIWCKRCHSVSPSNYPQLFTQLECVPNLILCSILYAMTKKQQESTVTEAEHKMLMKITPGFSERHGRIPNSKIKRTILIEKLNYYFLNENQYF